MFNTLFKTSYCWISCQHYYFDSKILEHIVWRNDIPDIYPINARNLRKQLLKSICKLKSKKHYPFDFKQMVSLDEQLNWNISTSSTQRSPKYNSQESFTINYFNTIHNSTERLEVLVTIWKNLTWVIFTKSHELY